MNKEEIDKWLDEEYGCSYTRLEELHDFYFEKYTNLKQENKQLKEEKEELKKWLEEEIKRKPTLTTFFFEVCNKMTSISEIEQKELKRVLDKIKELEEGVKE